MKTIHENTSVTEVVKSCPNARRIFDRHGLRGCEHGPRESLSFFATVHQVNLHELVRAINDEMRNPSVQPYVYKETCRTSGGSRARAYALTGDVFAEEPCCIGQPKSYLKDERPADRISVT